MKKIYTLLMLLSINTVLFAQTLPLNDFTNGGGDGLWSNALNWGNGLPDATQIARTANSAVLFVDISPTILSLQNLGGTTSDRFVNSSNGGVLTIAPTAANGIAIQNVSSSGVKLGFRGTINIQNTTATNFSRITQANGATNTIEFESSSVLTLSTPVELAKGGAAPNGANTFFFNGKIGGTGNLRLAANTAATFGNTVSNAGYTGELVLLANTAFVVNTSDDVIFYDGLKIQVNGNSSTTLNGANVFASGIVVGGSNTFTFNVNRNQSSMTNIIFQGGGTLNMVIDNAVTNLAFANNAGNDWSTGTINITGFQNGVIRFGTDNTGLTAAQLTQIVVPSVTLGLDANGFLVDATTLSLNDIEKNTVSPIVYPTLATDKLFFSKPQNNIKIYDVSGKAIFQNTSKNQSEVSINTLSKGMYFIQFDSKKVEKFIKK